MGRLNPDERYKQLLDSAVEVAKKCGFNNITHALVALHAKVSKATVFKYFESIIVLRDDVMKVAIEQELLPVIAAGLIMRNDIALSASDDLKERALASVL